MLESNQSQRAPVLPLKAPTVRILQRYAPVYALGNKSPTDTKLLLPARVAFKSKPSAIEKGTIKSYALNK